MWQSELKVKAPRRGLFLITDRVKVALPELPKQGMLNLFMTHTSASLLIQENSDPTAREDLENFFLSLCPDGEGWHRHTIEGEDDTTSHMKSALTQVSLNVPISQGRLALGTWQGLYLFEHRLATPERKILLSLW